MPRTTDPFAQSWWAQRWLGMLDDFGPEFKSRMGRGRTYARQGAVLNAAVGPGMVQAQVWGSYGMPYTVRITIAPLPDAVWDAVVEALATEAAAVAKLLAGEMPANIEDIFARAGGSLFPTSARDVSGSCTCPDYAPLCKHVVAVHHVVAQNLDAQPFILFTLRGRTPEQITAALRQRWASAVSGAGGQAAEPAPGEPAEPEYAPLRAANFYLPGAALDDFSITITPPQVEAALLKRLGRPPFSASDEDPLPALAEVYAAVTKRALQAFGRSGEKRRSSKG
jgi:uncharacterized Zn finger protein